MLLVEHEMFWGNRANTVAYNSRWSPSSIGLWPLSSCSTRLPSASGSPTRRPMFTLMMFWIFTGSVGHGPSMVRHLLYHTTLLTEQRETLACRSVSGRQLRLSPRVAWVEGCESRVNPRPQPWGGGTGGFGINSFPTGSISS